MYICGGVWKFSKKKKKDASKWTFVDIAQLFYMEAWREGGGGFCVTLCASKEDILADLAVQRERERDATPKRDKNATLIPPHHHWVGAVQEGGASALARGDQKENKRGAHQHQRNGSIGSAHSSAKPFIVLYKLQPRRRPLEKREYIRRCGHTLHRVREGIKYECPAIFFFFIIIWKITLKNKQINWNI